MKNEKSNAENYFNDAKLLDEKNKYNFIRKNLSILEIPDRPKYKKKYTSLVYFYLPLVPYSPKLNNAMNVPVLFSKINPPNEMNEYFSMKNECTSTIKRKLIIEKELKAKKVNRKPFHHCSKV